MRNLKALQLGGGKVDQSADRSFRLAIPPISKGYSNAQIDDYQTLPRHKFQRRPPVVLRLRARASSAEPLGTLGFGFWNDPLSLSMGLGGAARRLPAGPQAIWFFYGSPPNDMSFTANLPGHGWRAASLVARISHPLVLGPAATAGFVLARLPLVRRAIVHAIKRAMQATEAILPANLDEWHDYEIIWGQDTATFEVDGQQVLVAHAPPVDPLGFVAWIDNQYAVVSPEQGLRFGTLPLPAEQWMEIADLEITPADD